ncbi:insect inhibitor with A fungal trypsin [Byssothecium circinans]|uniref:Insect inhibitor with A fungal trypsin n=1 Tax=Byssothecium circinans TaxID=147558 RepID=A0A6A5U1Z7_9PLEO|nr:insect inhibitor with A fungal trypsin [Byssothecium circinans]
MGLQSLLVALAAPALALAAAIPQDASVQIVGGVAASAGDFPFIVSVQTTGGSHFCGGSLLNANTVITAGHCAQGMSASSVQIRAGSLTRNSGGTVVRVSRIVIHPSFNGTTLDSDVAILKLATSIPTSSTIGYATLPAANSDPTAGVVHTVAGWGVTSSTGGSSPIALLKVDVPIVSRTECRAAYGTSAVTNTMFCAGYSAGGRDSCQGDSGGPIVNSAKVLVGTVSWGEGCAEPNFPGVYGRVSTLLPFINANLG